MKNVLLLLSGGTICSSVTKKGTLSVNGQAGTMLKKRYYDSKPAFGKKAVKISETENLFILSENMTVKKWNLMAKTLRDYQKTGKYDGIIIAHGTDTLAYSAALFSILLNRTDIPVFFVSANRRLGDERSNGDQNFRTAVECICYGIRPGVYVTYRNISNGKTYLHFASRIRQCANYSEDFLSDGMLLLSSFTKEGYEALFSRLEKRFPRKEFPVSVDFTKMKALSNCVLYLPPYVGMNYEAYCYEKFKAVLHGSYHSGTACAEQTEDVREYGENSILRMMDLCEKNRVDLYISPSKAEGEVYDTVRIIAEHKAGEKKINFLYGTTNETAYAKLLIAYSLFTKKEKIQKFLETEFDYEFVR